MIEPKTKEEIAIMQKGGAILSQVLWEVVGAIKPGVTELALDKLAETLILKRGGQPGFKKVPGYQHTICVSTNDVVVHGIPTDYVLQKEDIIGIDCGIYYRGFHTDMAHTIRVQAQNDNNEIDKFLQTGEKALKEAIKIAREGNRVGHISKTIQNIIEKEEGYSVVRTLVGHGIGRKLHEAPEVPGFLQGSIEDTPKLTAGMAIAVEVIYNKGSKEVLFKNNDGWTIGTKDQSVSGLFERTIAITKEDPIVLTS